MSLRSTLNDQCKSAKQEPNLSRPDNSECICGCRGRPLGSFKFEAEKFSYENYKICPARLNRKAKERYQKTKHRAAGRAQRKATRFAELQKEKAALKKEKAKGKVKEKRDWERRKLNNLAPESRKEAAFRGYKTYIGNPCKRGHNGERETRSGQCIHCREWKERKLLSVCGRCMIHQFCSRECQIANWPKHKCDCDMMCSKQQWAKNKTEL